MRLFEETSGLPVGVPLIWVGAVSFETRSVAGVRKCVETGGLCEAFVVDYATVVRPVRAGEKRRSVNRSAIFRCLTEGQARIHRTTLFPYRMSAISRLLWSISAALQDGTQLVVDVSCFTKIHAVAFAEWLFENEDIVDRLFIQSTAPEQYGWQQSQALLRGDYRELMFMPLGETSSVDMGDGWRSTVDVIGLLGHEGLRYRLALTSLEIEKGLAILSRQARPNDDAGLMARLENAEFLEDATGGRNGDWIVEEVSPADLRKIHGVIGMFVSNAPSDRIVLIPLGPKPLILQAVLSAMGAAPSGSVWVNYPIPHEYSFDYSVGVGSTKTFRCRR